MPCLVISLFLFLSTGCSVLFEPGEPLAAGEPDGVMSDADAGVEEDAGELASCGPTVPIQPALRDAVIFRDEAEPGLVIGYAEFGNVGAEQALTLGLPDDLPTYQQNLFAGFIAISGSEGDFLATGGELLITRLCDSGIAGSLTRGQFTQWDADTEDVVQGGCQFETSIEFDLGLPCP